MIQTDQLLEKKKAALLEVFNYYKNVELNIEPAMHVILEVEILFDQMSELDKQLSQEEKDDFAEQHRDLWTAIIQKHKEIIELINSANESLRKQMTQMGKKNQVIHNYMDKNESLFLDRRV